jgi:hypothetical protein
LDDLGQTGAMTLRKIIMSGINPYREPNFKLKQSQHLNSKIDLTSIVQSGGISLVVHVVWNLLPLEHGYSQKPLLNWSVLMGSAILPFIAGAVHLAWKVKAKWPINGLIYCISLFFVIGILHVALSPDTHLTLNSGFLIESLFLLYVAIVTTLVAMLIIRRDRE